MHGLRLPFADTSTLHNPTMHSECLVHMLCHHNKNVLCYHNLGVLVSTEGLHAEFHECVVSESQFHSPTPCEQFPCTFVFYLCPFIFLSFYPFIFSVI